MRKKEGILSSGFVLDNRYKITFFLSEGNGCESYRAVGSDGRSLLLKIFDINKLDPDRLYNTQPLEIYLMKRIKHPGVLSFIANGSFTLEGNKFLYLVTEFPVGNTLEKQLKTHSISTFYDIKSILRDILNALTYLHSFSEPIIYNNISSSSIIINQENGEYHAKLIDFSAARLFLSDSPTKILSSDLRYIPTETIQACIISKHTDLFGIGVVLYQMLCNSLPWAMDECLPKDQDSILAHRRQSKLKTPEISDRLADYEVGIEDIIKRALSTNPSQYFNSAKEILDDLEKGKTSVPQPLSAQIPQKNDSPSKLASGKKGFEAIAGMNSLKQLVQRDVLDILKNPDEYKRHHLGLPNGMILYGPPGCGKTFFAERFAEEAGYHFIKVIASDLASIYVHGTQQKIGQLFKEAKEQAPAILYFDELDAMVPNRNNEAQHQRGEVNEFLSQLDNIGESGIFVIGSTNRPDLIDTAVLRAGRLEKHIYVPPPDFEARKEMFRLYLGNRPVDLGINYDELAQLTEHYVSADIKFLVDEASRTVISEKLKRITLDLLKNIIKTTPPSLTLDMERSYESFKVEQGSSKHIGFLNN